MSKNSQVSSSDVHINTIGKAIITADCIALLSNRLFELGVLIVKSLTSATTIRPIEKQKDKNKILRDLL